MLKCRLSPRSLKKGAILAKGFPLVVAAHSRESLHGAMSLLKSDRIGGFS